MIETNRYKSCIKGGEITAEVMFAEAYLRAIERVFEYGGVDEDTKVLLEGMSYLLEEFTKIDKEILEDEKIKVIK